MISKKFLSPNFVSNLIDQPKIKAYAQNSLYNTWINFSSMCVSFSDVYPWGADLTYSLLQKCYDHDFKYNWVSFIKLAIIIDQEMGDVPCCKELLRASCLEWVKQDYGINKTICIYTSIDPTILIVGKKSSDPRYPCKLFDIKLEQALYNDEKFCKISTLTDVQKFSKQNLYDVELYE